MTWMKAMNMMSSFSKGENIYPAEAFEQKEAVSTGSRP
jgi:hypothetical protein